MDFIHNMGWHLVVRTPVTAGENFLSLPCPHPFVHGTNIVCIYYIKKQFNSLLSEEMHCTHDINIGVPTL